RAPPPGHTRGSRRRAKVPAPAAPAIPDGIAIKPIRLDDEPSTMAMFETAFSEFADRLPSSETTWRAMTVEREGFAPEDLLVALDGDEVIGGALLLDSEEIWVDKLAV